jgi:calcium-dependent protein kinase
MLRAINFLCRCLSRPDDDEDGHEFPVEKLYEFGEVIGQGRLGVVYKCTDRTTGEQFACKKMPATGNAMREMDSLYMLQQCLPRRHPGILRSIAYFPQERVGKYGWSKNVYMISDLCDGGDLQHFIDAHDHGILSERLAARIIQSLVQSLQYCHSWKIIHRDVKPSSIFISNTANNVNPSSWVFKLGNFDRSICNGTLQKYS